MLNSNLRIIIAVVFSMAVHGMLIATEFGPGLAPVAGLSRKKVSVRLVSRRPASEKPVEMPAARQPEKVARKQPAVLPEVVEVAVKEIPPFTEPDRPVVPELAEDISDPRIEEGTESTTEGSSALPSAEVKARPLYLDNPPPEYPALARRRHWQGTVVLEVMVSREGKVLQLRVGESSGRDVLDEAALKAVSTWRFEPGRRGSRRVEMQVLVPVRFNFR